MQIEQLLPFEYIPKGSRVIIYGHGLWGQLYIQQIKITGWCEIVGIIDKKYQGNNKDGFVDIDYCKNNNNYDYIIIAVKSQSVCKMIQEQLEDLGVDKEKIVSHLQRYNYETELAEQLCCEDSKIRIQFIITGGIGDGVMETAFYHRLVELVPDAIIDIYGESYLYPIYRHKHNVRNIFDCRKVLLNNKDYDLVIQASWGVTIHYCNYNRIKNLAGNLYRKVIENEEAENTYGHMQGRESFIFRIKEAQINHKNRFWLMGRGDIWNLSSEMMRLELKEEFESQYKALNLNKYITVNTGTDVRYIENEDTVITKAWPVEYFELFVRLFKNKYPEYEIVQIGSKEASLIKGADRKFLGGNIELVKYILLHSILHVDDEGGLVHMATALGTKCAVLFGPTPMDIFSYAQNINICVGECSNCFGAVSDWNISCLNKTKRKKCMYDIKPEMVMERIKEYMDRY